MLTPKEARISLLLSHRASRENKAYRVRALKAHPNKGGSAEAFRCVKDAQDLLLQAMNAVYQVPNVSARTRTTQAQVWVRVQVQVQVQVTQA